MSLVGIPPAAAVFLRCKPSRERLRCDCCRRTTPPLGDWFYMGIMPPGWTTEQCMIVTGKSRGLFFRRDFCGRCSETLHPRSSDDLSGSQKSYRHAERKMGIK